VNLIRMHMCRMMGSAGPMARPVFVGSAGPMAQPVMYRSSGPMTAPVMYGSSGPMAAPIMYGSSGPMAAPVMYGSSGPMAVPVMYGSSRPMFRGSGGVCAHTYTFFYQNTHSPLVLHSNMCNFEYVYINYSSILRERDPEHHWAL